MYPPPLLRSIFVSAGVYITRNIDIFLLDPSPFFAISPLNNHVSQTSENSYLLFIRFSNDYTGEFNKGLVDGRGVFI